MLSLSPLAPRVLLVALSLSVACAHAQPSAATDEPRAPATPAASAAVRLPLPQAAPSDADVPPATTPEKLPRPDLDAQPDVEDARTDNAEAQPGEPLSAIVARMKKSLPLRQGRVVVLKRQRTLQLFDGATLLKSYRVSLGPRPTGAKARRGDGRTPEGEYFICTRNAKTSAFHIFLGLSYPALPDARRGVRLKKLSPREYQMIRSRLASRQAPPWRTKLGGWIGIHGGSDQKFAARLRAQRKSPDWTAGCIAVNDWEIEEISAALELGARVSVRP